MLSVLWTIQKIFQHEDAKTIDLAKTLQQAYRINLAKIKLGKRLHVANSINKGTQTSMITKT